MYMKFGKTARVPFSIAAVLALILSLISATYVYQISSERHMYITSKPATKLDDVGLTIAKEIELKAYYIASQKVIELCNEKSHLHQPPTLETLNEEFQKEFSVWISSNFPKYKYSQSYDIFVEDYIVFIVGEEQWINNSFKQIKYNTSWITPYLIPEIKHRT